MYPCRADPCVYPVPLNVSGRYNPHKAVRDLSITFSAHLTPITCRYNQPTIHMANGVVKGTLYTGPLDCLIKTVRTEGSFALYKGVLVPCHLDPAHCSTAGASAHFLRITPHITILLTANEYFTRWYKASFQN